VCVILAEPSVDLTTLFACRELEDGGPVQRVAELESPGRLVDENEFRVLRWSKGTPAGVA
jgi:hypothetical protein